MVIGGSFRIRKQMMKEKTSPADSKIKEIFFQNVPNLGGEVEVNPLEGIS